MYILFTYIDPIKYQTNLGKCTKPLDFYGARPRPRGDVVEESRGQPLLRLSRQWWRKASTSTGWRLLSDLLGTLRKATMATHVSLLFGVYDPYLKRA